MVTAGVKDTIDDIIGLVKGMTLFGTGTRPNRNPLKSEDNGKFFTVPVKLTFASKQVAIRVTEVLKGTYKLPITTPYHKSLRACFTHVQKKVRALNPGYQVRVNLDAKNRLLKASVRPAEKCPWELLTDTFPLPQEALDPKFQDLKSMVLPSLGSPAKSPPSRRSSSKSMDCGDHVNAKNKTLPSAKNSAKSPVPTNGSSADNTKNSGGIFVSNRFSALARTPPLPSQKEMMARLASRICVCANLNPLLTSPFKTTVILALYNILILSMLDAVIPPNFTFSTINCNSLNVSDLGSIHHLVKLYGIAKLKTDVIFLSDIRLCNARGVSNFHQINNTFRTNPYCSYKCYFNSRSNKRGVGILIKNNSGISVLQEIKREDDNSILLRAEHKGNVFILASIYGPKTHCPNIFENLTQDIASVGDFPVVVGGGTGIVQFPPSPLTAIRMFYT